MASDWGIFSELWNIKININSLKIDRTFKVRSFFMKNIFRYGYLKHKITLYFKGRFNKPSSKNKGPIGRLGISNFCG